MITPSPEVTAYFWIIKILCTTVGETSGYLNMSVDLGLTGTSVVTGLLLAVVLAARFAADRYRPARYWAAVTLVSVFGTLVTDNLTDALGVPLEVSTAVFGVLLACALTAWYRAEGTLSIHSILTRRREMFYRLAILFTFTLGTATGDLMAQVLGLGYLVGGLVVAAVIAATAVAWRLGMHGVSQPAADGGLGLGPTMTSAIFLVAIVATVAYLAASKADVIVGPRAGRSERAERGGLVRTVVVVGLLVAAGSAGYVLRSQALQTEAAPTTATAPAPDGAAAVARPAPSSRLGDTSAFRTITQDTLASLNSGDQAGATTRIRDLEIAWDDAQARLKPKDPAAWTELDGKIDTVLRELRAASLDVTAEKSALSDLLTALR